MCETKMLSGATKNKNTETQFSNSRLGMIWCRAKAQSMQFENSHRNFRLNHFSNRNSIRCSIHKTGSKITNKIYCIEREKWVGKCFAQIHTQSLQHHLMCGWECHVDTQRIDPTLKKKRSLHCLFANLVAYLCTCSFIHSFGDDTFCDIWLANTFNICRHKLQSAKLHRQNYCMPIHSNHHAQIVSNVWNSNTYNLYRV